MTLQELRPGARLFAYLRDSGGSGQERSIIEQRLDVERYVTQRGWLVVDWFVDTAVASGNYARRNEFAALLDACLRNPPPVDGVITYTFSRFGRDDFDSPYYRLELRRHGVQVVSATEATVAGFESVMEAFIDWKNRVFLDDMSRHVRAGLRHNVEAGYAPGGSAPTGYKAVPVEIGKRRDGRARVAARWVVDPDVGPKVTEAFRLAADGLPYEDILRQTGLPIKKSSLRSLLINRTYLGVIKFGAEEFPGLEPLVDQATWDKVQGRFVSRAEQAQKARRNMATDYLLSGLAVCGQCGTAMIGGVDRRHEYAGVGRPWRFYRCREHGRVAADKAELAVIRVMLDSVLTLEHMRRMLARMREIMQDPAVGEELVELGPRIAEKRRVIDTLLDAVEQGGGGATQERLNQREAELAQLEARRRELENRMALAAAPFGEEQLERIVGEMRAQVTDEEAGVVRHVLRQWVRAVTLWEAEFKIDFREVDLAPVMQVYSAVPPRGYLVKTYRWPRLPLAYYTKT